MAVNSVWLQNTWEKLHPKMPRVIVFDFDGTLVDSMRVWDDIGQDWVHKKGLPEWPTMQDEMAVATIQDAAKLTISHYKLESVCPYPSTQAFMECVFFFFHCLLLLCGCVSFLCA